ncbi:MAG: sigma 54-interacting transcriptional regulator [Gammaproteobacteria bacterium]
MKRQLSGDERSFLGRACEQIYANPFEMSAGMPEIPWGTPPGTVMADVGGDHPLGSLGRAVDEFISQMDVRGPVRLRDFSPADAELVSHSLLFQVYHRHVDDMNRHIVGQMDAPERLQAVSYAPSMLEALAERGFTPRQSERYLALFFQLRRAYYFIDETLVGDCPSMSRLRQNLWAAVFSNDARRYDRFLWNRMEDFSILLLGPTGSGKGVAAAAIGRSAYIPYDAGRRRFAENFAANQIQANLSEYPENLIESALFGHRKGAFTGAVDTHQGLFQRCTPHGCLFLDEIGDISASVQVKLLRVLQERRFTAVGSHDTRQFSGRLITATHRDMDALRAEGGFRDDLYYRLSALVIEIPSLHQRIRESAGELDRMIELLVARTLGNPDPEITAGIRQSLSEQLPADYSWPGNVRELEQAVRRTLLAMPFTPAMAKPPAGDSMIASLMRDQPTAKALLGEYCSALYAVYGGYEEVARRVGLDRRTVKKHLGQG